MILGKWQSTDEEKRRLQISLKAAQKGLQAQREARAELEKRIKKLNKENKEQKEIIEKLKEENEELRKQRDRYRDIIIKPNKNSEEENSEKQKRNNIVDTEKKKIKRGGQIGHKGKGKKKPEKIDLIRKIYLDRCPECSSKLKRTNSYKRHIVEDIPDFEKIKPEIIEYQIEEQWCPCCKKKIKAIPKFVIPKSKYGINIIIYILLQKYGTKSTLEAIVFNLKEIFGINISKGTIVEMLHRARKHFKEEYECILERIRGAPVKHADETGHRINGINGYAWGFFTDKEAYYTMEESRGKVVAEKILEGSHEKDVLVRDDYAGYKNLPLKHQSCWAHLLRKSHEASEDKNASDEVKKFHSKLKEIFEDISKIIEKPFKIEERKKFYVKYSEELKQIIHKEYKKKDSQSIQTRIKNQNKNLITALMYKNVPLTNNLSERMLRPLVVCRKISGGSRSSEGSKTLAVNMSVFQTIKMNNQPLIPNLINLISQ